MVEFVLGHFAAEGIAVNAENGGGARLVAVGAIEDALNEAFFKFADRLVEKDTTLDHLQN